MKTKDEVKHNFGNTETDRYTVETLYKQYPKLGTHRLIETFTIFSLWNNCYTVEPLLTDTPE